MANSSTCAKVGSRRTKLITFATLVSSMFLLMVWWNNATRTRTLPTVPVTSSPVESDVIGKKKPATDGAAFKRILLWTSYFGHNDFYFGLGRDAFLRRRCSVTSCEMTTDRSLLRRSDAVVFHFNEAHLNNFPKWKGQDQRWIFYLRENPESTSVKKLKSYDGLFNWTMTYRLDSDVITSYGYSSQIKATSLSPPTVTSSMSERRHLAVWIVSHCKTKGKREEYVEELQRHMQVDVYGACAKNETRRTCPEESCGAALYRSHKFYLAFENSVCRDYVTEKFFKALRHGIVPVVYGGADYERMAPPGSYVDVRDFESPRHLAEYLKEVDANDTLYEKYFDWTADWEVGSDWDGQRDFCRLCAALHRPLVEKKVYDDLVAWWKSPDVCQNEKGLL